MSPCVQQRLRDYLDELDRQTRLPGEEPLRKTVARQAREAREQMEGRRHG